MSSIRIVTVVGWQGVAHGLQAGSNHYSLVSSQKTTFTLFVKGLIATICHAAFAVPLVKYFFTKEFLLHLKVKEVQQKNILLRSLYLSAWNFYCPTYT